jgi:hypothetical protein
VLDHGRDRNLSLGFVPVGGFAVTHACCSTRWAVWPLVLAMGCWTTPCTAAGEKVRPEPILPTGHTAIVTSVALSGDTKYVATASADQTAILWIAATGQQLRTFAGHTDRVDGVALSGDATLLVTGSWDGTAILWESCAGKKLQTFQGHLGAVTSVALSDDSKFAVTGSVDKTAILWDTATGKKLRTFQGHTGEVCSVALPGDGRRMVTGSADKTAILWDTATGKILRTFRGHTDKVHSVAVSRDCRQVLTGSDDNTAILWEVSSGLQRYTFDLYEEYRDKKRRATLEGVPNPGAEAVADAMNPAGFIVSGAERLGFDDHQKPPIPQSGWPVICYAPGLRCACKSTRLVQLGVERRRIGDTEDV